MPELPDVAIYKEYLDATALHQPIAEVHVAEAALLEDGLTPQSLGQRLVRHSLDGSLRHGKHLFAKRETDGALRLHFGMTGDLLYYRHPNDAPPHERARLTFENGCHLGFINPRKLGTVGWADDVDAWVTRTGLGPDALAIPRDEFERLVSGKRGTVKGALMDQRFIAGLGNVYVDEILFHIRWHPKTKIASLETEQVRELYSTMRRVLHQAIDARVEDWPDHFLVPHRAGGESCPRCGAPLKQMEVVGRTTWYCPDEQRRR